jgi:hypothetical protein
MFAGFSGAIAGLPAALSKLNAPALVLPKLQPFFAPTYIVVVDANAAGWNSRPNLPFVANEPVFVLFGSSFDDFQDMSDSQTLWYHLVSFGYQAGVTEDGDPKRGPWIESPLLGGTPKGGTLNARFSAIFVEAVSELWEYGNAARVLP